MAICRELDGRDVTTDQGIAAALEMPAAEATALLGKKHFLEGDLALLEAAAVRLNLRGSDRDLGQVDVEVADGIGGKALQGRFVPADLG